MPPASPSPRNSADERSATIDLAPFGQMSMADLIWLLLRRTAVWGIALIAAIIIARIGVGLVLASRVAEAMERTSRVAGLDASIAAWLKSFTSLGFGFGMVGLLARTVLGWIWPFGRDRHQTWKPFAIMVAVSGLGVTVPTLIQSVRHVDSEGLPAQMSEVVPAAVTWFNPRGEALIFFADHLDGQRRFWNRPGHTPRDSAVAEPVTPAVHSLWLRHEAEAQRANTTRQQAEAQAKAAQQEAQRRAVAAAEATSAAERQRLQAAHAQEVQRLQEQTQKSEALRLEAERQKAEAEKLRQEADRQRAEAERHREEEAAAARKRAAAPADDSARTGTSAIRQTIEKAAPPVRALPLRWGATLHLNVNGSRIAVWSDGPIATGSDHFALRTVPVPGQPMRFQRGAGVLHVQPLSTTATTVFIQGLTD